MPAQNFEVDLNPKKSAATANRREGVYNRAGEPSVTFAEKRSDGVRDDDFSKKVVANDT